MKFPRVSIMGRRLWLIVMSACLSLPLLCRAEDPPEERASTVGADANAAGAAIKRDAKVVADAAKQGAEQVAAAAKEVAHEVAVATQHGAEHIAAAAKRGADKTRAAPKAEKKAAKRDETAAQ